ncbi:cation:proton antiporter domain-containing protein [Halolamina salifodinae]|uniref:NhaP-type Na+/H+ or K+/H+ antiporter n=1 Tax=Halolamina salifodinae TaxID=1202767 RepID=A0A8T4GY97_9EURY|nr:cation:proton antiporter [Halolamina salifodinae]MBP1986325.1 NhaP-type Na+/H+ or K+/H+ antiporter [Halolamina salifodinae]
MAGAESAVLIALVAGIIGVGVVAQVLSDRFQIPSIVFLIAAGILLGPEVAGVLNPDEFGTALPAIVGLSVAIIVFEGAFHLRIEELREAPKTVFRLVTVGALIAFVGTSVAVHLFLGVGWLVSMLVGSLLVATGPTVIAPILDIVPVRDRVGIALDTEGIVNDVTAAITAVVIFNIITTDASGAGALIRLFAERLGYGLLVGMLVAGLLYYLLQYVDLSPGNAPRNARLLVLAGALVAYAAANYLASESGVAAVAVAGMLLGNADVPYEEDIAAFKGDVTLVVLSFVFIMLAALLDFDVLLDLGVAGIGIVVVVALVLRPLLVFVSSVGDRFTRGEKLFMSVVGPRGIIPASVATLFAIELRSPEIGMPEAADVLVGTVFLTILLTVVFEAGLARRIAEKLNIIPMRVITVGGGDVGRELATRLEDRGEDVVIVEKDQDRIQRARDAGFTVHAGDGTETEVLRSAGADNAKFVIAATGDDDANLLISQLSQSKFDPEEVITRTNNPENVDAFEELGVTTISSAMATAQAMDNHIERPALANWMRGIGESGDVQEIEVTADVLVGQTVRDIGPELPEGCLIGLVCRDEESFVPEADYTLQRGDRITFIGRKEAVREAMTWAHPEE